jgi:hypothetical protein
MNRSPAKLFEDERTRRAIRSIEKIEELRQLCLLIYDAKVTQEEIMLKMLFDSQGLTREQVACLLPRPQLPNSQ